MTAAKDKRYKHPKPKRLSEFISESPKRQGAMYV